MYTAESHAIDAAESRTSKEVVANAIFQVQHRPIGKDGLLKSSVGFLGFCQRLQSPSASV